MYMYAHCKLGRAWRDVSAGRPSRSCKWHWGSQSTASPERAVPRSLTHGTTLSNTLSSVRLGRLQPDRPRSGSDMVKCVTNILTKIPETVVL